MFIKLKRTTNVYYVSYEKENYVVKEVITYLEESKLISYGVVHVNGNDIPLSISNDIISSVKDLSTH